MPSIIAIEKEIRARIEKALEGGYFLRKYDGGRTYNTVEGPVRPQGRCDNYGGVCINGAITVGAPQHPDFSDTQELRFYECFNAVRLGCTLEQANLLEWGFEGWGWTSTKKQQPWYKLGAKLAKDYIP